jgi:hypothetical protein
LLGIRAHNTTGSLFCYLGLCISSCTPSWGKEKAMNILVFGAGVIGKIYAWQLSEAEQNVALLVRCGRKQEIEGGVI